MLSTNLHDRVRVARPVILLAGLPEFIPGTRASTMPIPRVFNFSSILKKMTMDVDKYLRDPTAKTANRPLDTSHTRPTLTGLAKSVGASFDTDFYKITGGIRMDPVDAALKLKITLLMNVAYHTQFRAGSDTSKALESTCNSLYARPANSVLCAPLPICQPANLVNLRSSTKL